MISNIYSVLITLLQTLLMKYMCGLEPWSSDLYIPLEKGGITMNDTWPKVMQLVPELRVDSQVLQNSTTVI